MLDIALKDLRQRVRDRSAILVAIVAPFALAALFSLMLGDLEADFHATWGVVDRDGGELAATLVDGPLRDLESGGVVTLRRLPTREAALAQVEEGTVQTAIVIPEGFSAAIQGVRGASIEVISDPDAGISAQVARSVLEGFSSRVEAVRLAVATALATAGAVPDAETSQRLAARAQELAEPIVVEDDAAADRSAPLETYYAAAMSILFVFLGAQFGVVSLLTEKRTRTLSRMLAAPLRPISIVAGKVLVSLTLAVVSMAIIVVGTALLLGARWGDPLALAALIAAASIAATGVALLATAFARTEDQAGSAVAIATITLAILGGAFFPVAQTSDLMAQLSLLTPHAWYLRGVDDISTGGGIVSSAGPILVLLAIGLLAGTLGAYRARRTLIS